ncbi:RNHCP domain-containing protein [Candidatus Peregrinibacteria bacterium]|nr:RNHCP domain-containing protein [Candidatus Peregrinibacteria bacterium]
MIDINIQFNCKKCGQLNPPADQTCRNHCIKCLYSLHVDQEIPGDRLSSCHNLMEPVGLDQNSKKGFIIVHKCLKCGKVINNKAAPDDDTDTLIQLSKKQNLGYYQ